MADSKNKTNNKKKDKEDEDLKKTISSGYTDKEINDIVSKAKQVHLSKTNELINKHQKTKNSTLTMPFNRQMMIGTQSDCKNFAQQEQDQYSYFEVNGQPLRIALGLKVERDVKVAETRMHSGFDNTSYAAVKHLYFQGDAGLRFSVTVLLRNTDRFIGEQVNKEYIEYYDPKDSQKKLPKTVIAVLNDWCRTFTLCKITSLSEIIENGYYRITKFSPQQIYNNYVQIEMTFVQDTYNYAQPLQSKQTMSHIENVDIHEGGVIKNIGGGQPVLSGLAKQLNECSNIKKQCKCIVAKAGSCVATYSKCVLILQHALREVGLYFDGKLDGIFCYVTRKAIMEYQRRHEYDLEDALKVNGEFDELTKKRLVSDLMTQSSASVTISNK